MYIMAFIKGFARALGEKGKQDLRDECVSRRISEEYTHFVGCVKKSATMSSRVQHWTGRLLAEAQFGHVIIIAGIVKPHPIKCDAKKNIFFFKLTNK